MSNLAVAVVVPTYNERENLPDLVRALLALPLKVQVIIVDDNSPDGTGQLADRLALETGRVAVIHRPSKQGLGTAYTAGFRCALQFDVDCIITMDADFSHDPHYVPTLVERTALYDLVIGSRYVPGGGIQLWGWERRLLSWGANMIARRMLGLQVHDCTAGFRCYRRQALEAIDLDSIRADGYSYLVEMLFRCQLAGLTIGEVPIVFVDRRRGASKISRQEIFKAGFTVFRLAWGRVWRWPTVSSADRTQVKRSEAKNSDLVVHHR
ncbi:MAG: polyprenol monophosphomannose synthase [Anaerolineae bacterium]|nr:polyprenol monophosphomannose synthase [Anaerolineae bacterium]MDW8098234.1 polyprenol monophosphomannose synthase [Anaerolineae bacterium]